jgi:hypothetical protein
MAGMTLDEVKAILRANEGRRVRITFRDGVIQYVDINSADTEGFLHSDPEGTGQKHWWTRYEDIKFIDCVSIE